MAEVQILDLNPDGSVREPLCRCGRELKFHLVNRGAVRPRCPGCQCGPNNCDCAPVADRRALATGEPR